MTKCLSTKLSVKGYPPSEKTDDILQNVIKTNVVFIINACINWKNGKFKQEIKKAGPNSLQSPVEIEKCKKISNLIFHYKTCCFLGHSYILIFSTLLMDG